MGAILLTCVFLLLYGSACCLIGYALAAHRLALQLSEIRREAEKEQLQFALLIAGRDAGDPRKQ